MRRLAGCKHEDEGSCPLELGPGREVKHSLVQCYPRLRSSHPTRGQGQTLWDFQPHLQKAQSSLEMPTHEQLISGVLRIAAERSRGNLWP